MIRLLCLSDIHDNTRAVELLCAAEEARHDAVVVAGDMGSATATETLGRLVDRFRCPVLYVLGNWDARLPYGDLVPGAHHLHGAPVRLRGMAIAGFSGCAANWGRNPIAAAVRAEFGVAPGDARRVPDAARRAALREADRRIVAANVAMVAESAPAVVVAHERVFRLRERVPAARLHLFGHVHGFRHTSKGALDNVNVSSLDWPRPGPEQPERAGYAVIEVAGDGTLAAEARRLG